MLEFHERRKLKQFLYSKGTLVALAALAVVLGNASWNIYEKERASVARRAEREAELADLTERSAVLAAEIERLSTARGVEEEIRKKFEVAGPGEGVIILVEPPREATVTPRTRGAGIVGWVRSFFSR